MDETTKAIFERVFKNIKDDLSDEARHSIAFFIHNGTQTTQWLGAGERGGALNSCISAFGKAPQTSEEWQDVIKIANGRWSSEKSIEAENRAQSEFKKIYLRDPDMDNPHDNATVTVIAYGLRSVNRNMDSEKNAIKIFKSIFKYNPVSALDWDMMRAIAYSGATR